jgi:hypothetical protein
VIDYRIQPVNMRVWAHLQIAEPNRGGHSILSNDLYVANASANKVTLQLWVDADKAGRLAHLLNTPSRSDRYIAQIMHVNREPWDVRKAFNLRHDREYRDAHALLNIAVAERVLEHPAYSLELPVMTSRIWAGRDAYTATRIDESVRAAEAIERDIQAARRAASRSEA